MDVTLSTTRLTLRQPVKADADAIVAGLNDVEVTHFLTRVPFPYAKEDALYWLGTLRPARPGAVHLAIDLQGEGLIGVVGIETELGYWLNRKFHGRGYMTEACAALLDWHFANLPVSIVHSGAHAGNTASLHVQDKLGFRDTGARSMRFVRSHNREIEHVETTLARADFEAARSRLGGR